MPSVSNLRRIAVVLALIFAFGAAAQDVPSVVGDWYVSGTAKAIFQGKAQTSPVAGILEFNADHTFGSIEFRMGQWTQKGTKVTAKFNADESKVVAGEVLTNSGYTGMFTIDEVKDLKWTGTVSKKGVLKQKISAIAIVSAPQGVIDHRKLVVKEVLQSTPGSQ